MQRYIPEARINAATDCEVPIHMPWRSGSDALEIMEPITGRQPMKPIARNKSDTAM
jgi:hypothetical protein